MLAKITSAQFRGWVKPGEQAVIHAEVKSSRPQFASTAAHIEVDGKQVCSAELFFGFLPADQFAPGYKDVVLEQFLHKQDPGA
jgi:3-hydroxymyristoyl/3-hydroxydecanoyl-(acyl carrier protein) dehydratase